MADYQQLTHEFPPIFNRDSRILIQGTAFLLWTSAEPFLESTGDDYRGGRAKKNCREEKTIAKPRHCHLGRDPKLRDHRLV